MKKPALPRSKQDRNAIAPLLKAKQELWLKAFLNKNYLDPSHEIGFTSIDKIYKYIRDHTKYDISKQEIKRVLETFDFYTRHRPLKRNFTRAKIIPHTLDYSWGCDLIDFSKPPFPAKNKQIKYIAVMIDIFSKFLWCYPLKTKSAKSMVAMFKKAFEGPHKRICKVLIVDRGMEFLAKDVKKYLNSKGISVQPTNSDKKSNFAERVIRTIKNTIFKLLTHRQSYVYIDQLQAIVQGYNNRSHSTIKMAPSAVTEDNSLELYRKVYMPRLLKDDQCMTRASPKYSKGQLVRIATQAGPFTKGYYSNFSEELFKIHALINSCPPRYKLIDLKDEPIIGSFYEQELTLVNISPDKDYFKIDKVLSTRRINKKLYHLVSWVGYGPEYNSYVSARDIIKWQDVRHATYSEELKPDRSTRKRKK